MQFPKSVIDAALRQESAGHFAPPPPRLRVLGVDTSLRSTGLGIVEFDAGRLRYVDARPVRNKPTLSLTECLLNLRKTTEAYIEEFKPDEAAFEGVFFFRNPKTALILGQARGVILCACAAAGIPSYEYPPKRVKQAATGAGAAVKGQVQAMMKALFSLDVLPQEDAADALAIAVAHAHERENEEIAKSRNHIL